jgi:para-nitrobenzyl esterase
MLTPSRFAGFSARFAGFSARFAGLLTLAALALMVSAAAASPARPVRATSSGPVHGVVEHGVAAFKGIPFAQPPVGELRWRAPQPVKAWTAARKAVDYGPDCLQNPFPGDAAPLGVKPAEDCLYLNVWAPAKAKPKAGLPVMVWIYGGGFVNGGSSPAIYSGETFARDGVVFISFNYRVGRFGFFGHPALSAAAADGGLLGNYGFLDQIAALKWVKANAAKFGGDPNNVTLFGESAGGMSVHVLLTSPLSRNLFQRAVIQSGGGRPRLLASLPLKAEGEARSAEKSGLAFAAKNGISGTGPEALKALRALPADAVVDGLNMATANTPTYAGGPIIDGRIIPREPWDSEAAGHWAKVPLIVGANSADGIPVPASRDVTFSAFGEHKAEAQAVYDPKGDKPDFINAVAVSGDRVFNEPARAVAKLLATPATPVWTYRFGYVAQHLQAKWPGAFHATEIPYVFDTVSARYGKDATSADQAAARIAHQYWLNFARTGHPGGNGLPGWPVFDPAKDQIMLINGDKTGMAPDPYKARLDFVESLVK